MKNKNDINITENLWIDWIEFDYKKSNPKDIDDLLEPTIKLWNRLDTQFFTPSKDNCKRQIMTPN